MYNQYYEQIVIRKLDKSEFLGENDEEMDKNIVDNSYSYFTFVSVILLLIFEFLHLFS